MEWEMVLCQWLILSWIFTETCRQRNKIWLTDFIARDEFCHHGALGDGAWVEEQCCCWCCEGEEGSVHFYLSIYLSHSFMSSSSSSSIMNYISPKSRRGGRYTYQSRWEEVDLLRRNHTWRIRGRRTWPPPSPARCLTLPDDHSAEAQRLKILAKDIMVFKASNTFQECS